MTDSVSKARSNMPEDVKARLAKYKETGTAANEKEAIADLPRWVKTALVLQAVDGLSYKEAAERFHKTGGTLSNYARSPAAKLWLASLSDFIEDPIAMAKAYLSANALSVTLERFIFLQAAIDAGDYATGDKIAADLQDRIGITKKAPKGDFGGMVLNITLPGGNVEPVRVESTHETLEGDFEMED